MKTPKTKRDITKSFMLSYIKGKKISDEDRKWFASICLENEVEKTNNLTKEKYNDIDIPKVRDEFIKKFFPEMLNQKKISFIDEMKKIAE